MARLDTDRRRTTLKDVAGAVGLSVNTVSRALSDQPGVSDATRTRIKAEAERIGYVPNVYARSLVLGSRKTIAMIVTNLSNPFFAELVSEVEARATAAGYTVVLLLSDESLEREENAVAAAMRSGVDGVIGVPVSRRSTSFRALLRAAIPTVLVSRELPDADFDVFANDNETGMRLTTGAVLARGARDVVLIEEDLPIPTVAHRIDGFRLALADHGLAFEQRMIALIPPRRSARAALPWQAEDAYRIATDLLQRGRRPDAFVLGNDFFALGLYAALREAGLRVPEDVMVIGWGDYPFSRYLDPPLSVLSLPSREVARRAVDRLLERLAGEVGDGAVRVVLPPEVVVRGSLPALPVTV